jgi:hypothetical protein
LRRVYFHGSARSAGLRELKRAFQDAGGDVLDRGPGDVVVWGQVLTGEVGQNWTVLNRAFRPGKLEQLKRLAEAGVNVPEVGRDPAWRAEPWLARKTDHHSGNDLLRRGKYRRPFQPDYWIRRIDTEREFRVHVFGGRSIRSGVKIPFEPNHHPFIRTRLGGWHISYGQDCQEQITKEVRAAAKAAVRALDLDFGCVDVGVTPDGKPVVFEVNTAPGLEPASARVYARKILEVE